jgi:Uncharacterized protein conserved in bacteria (DUF2059)
MLANPTRARRVVPSGTSRQLWFGLNVLRNMALTDDTWVRVMSLRMSEGPLMSLKLQVQLPNLGARIRRRVLVFSAMLAVIVAAFIPAVAVTRAQTATGPATLSASEEQLSLARRVHSLLAGANVVPVDQAMRSMAKEMLGDPLQPAMLEQLLAASAQLPDIMAALMADQLTIDEWRAVVSFHTTGAGQTYATKLAHLMLGQLSIIRQSIGVSSSDGSLSRQLKELGHAPEHLAAARAFMLLDDELFGSGFVATLIDAEAEIADEHIENDVEVRLTAIIDLMPHVYVSLLTKDELEKIVAFYSQSAGRRFLNAQRAIKLDNLSGEELSRLFHGLKPSKKK